MMARWWWPFGRKAREAREARQRREGGETRAAVPEPVSVAVGARVGKQTGADAGSAADERGPVVAAPELIPAPAADDEVPPGAPDALVTAAADATVPTEGEDGGSAAGTATSKMPAEHDQTAADAEAAGAGYLNAAGDAVLAYGDGADTDEALAPRGDMALPARPNAEDDVAGTDGIAAGARDGDAATEQASEPAAMDELRPAGDAADAQAGEGNDVGEAQAGEASTLEPADAMDAALEALEAGLSDPEVLREALRVHAALVVTEDALERARARVEAARAAGDQEREARAVAALGIVTGLQGMTADEVAHTSTQDEPATEEMEAAAEALNALVGARTWDEARRVLEERRAVLLSDAALELLRAAIQEQRDAGQHKAADELELLLRLLKRARDEGDDAAFAALERELEDEDLAEEFGEVPIEVRDILAQLEILTRLEDMPARIVLLEQALAQVTREDNGNLWVALQGELGNALQQNRLGDRRLQLQRAIACYDAALLEYRREVAPANWAGTQNNKGIALSELAGLVSGEARLATLRDAIACYDAALLEYRREVAPAAWAGTQNNMGAALLDLAGLLGGEARQQALRDAIACYDAALLERRREVAPAAWATTQNNKGNALRDLAGLLGGDARQQTLRQAMECYDNALLEYSRAVMPTDHREIAQRAGSWLFGEGEWAEAARFLSMALDALDDLFTLAVTARGREAELEAGGELTAHLAYALVRAAGPKAALAASRALERGRARATGEAVRRQRGEIAAAEARVAPELLEAFRAAAVRLAAFTLDDSRAVSDAAGGRGGPDTSDAGGEAMGTGPATTAPSSRYEEAKRAREEYDAAVARIREQVPGFLVPSDPLPGAARALRPDERLGYMASTPAGSVMVLVGGAAGGAGEPAAEAWWDEGLTRGLVVDLLERREGQGDERHIVGGLYHAQYGVGSLRDALEEAMGALGMPGGVLAELAARCRAEGIRRVVLVPGGLLGLLPLHAALVPAATMGAEPEPLLDSVRVSYAPSAAVWLACRERAVAFLKTPPRALVVGDPLPQQAAPPLPGAEEEARKVFAVVERDAGGQALLIETFAAERKAVLAALRELAAELTHAHFACHGEANITRPLDSGLLMANGARLMVRDLVGGDVPYLTRLRLAGLSACQTALQGTRLPDEAIGLPAGWLQAGAIGVLGSLWPISDDATVALMTRFYELHLLDGLEPGDALWLAQRWLRGLPSWREDFRAAGAVELAAGPEASEEVRGLRLARGEMLPEDGAAEDEGEEERSGRRKAPPRVWDDPLHWAAFALYGS